MYNLSLVSVLAENYSAFLAHHLDAEKHWIHRKMC